MAAVRTITNDRLVLQRDNYGVPSLWIERGAAGYTLCDDGASVAVDPDDDIDTLERDWLAATS